MRVTAVLLFTFVSVLVLAQQQPVIRTMKVEKNSPGVHRGGADELLHVPELSAMIAQDGGKILVDHIMDPQMRAKGYEKTELQEGDVIMMADGKKIGTLVELKEIYNAATIGSTVKLGVKRKEDMMIASFVKADPKDLPKIRMMISRDGDDEDVIAIPKAGLILSSKGKEVVVKDLLPNATDSIHADVKPGDIVVKLNGSTVISFKAFQRAYQKLAFGDHVELLTRRAGKTQKIEFIKPNDEGRVVIRRQGK